MSVDTPPRRPVRWRPRASGSSLFEALIAVGLSMPLVLYAITLVCESTREQLLCEQLALIEQDAQFALETIARVIELAGHAEAGSLSAGQSTLASPVLPPVHGVDDATMSASSDPFTSTSKPGVMGSDVLIIHHAGAEPAYLLTAPASAASPLAAPVVTVEIVNCAGMPVPPKSSAGGADLGYSVFYIARGTGGEPELRCKYRTATGWDSEPLVAGVEGLQFLYGVDHDDDGQPEQFLNAASIDAQAGSAQALWGRVVAVRVALLMRSTHSMPAQHGSGAAASAAQWHLFGESYSTLNAQRDKGTQLRNTDFPDKQQRLRRAFDQLVFLRNRLRVASIAERPAS